jgi:hypothetical protein
MFTNKLSSGQSVFLLVRKPAKTVLPKFSQFEIKQLAEGTAPEFKDAYFENRLQSLMHYGLALIEDPERRLEPFHKVRADGFELEFTSGRFAISNPMIQ